MKLKYKLDEEDFLEFHLFAISEHKQAKRVVHFGKYVLTFCFLYFGINLYSGGQFVLAILLGVLAILSLLFFNKIYLKQLASIQRKVVRKHYDKRIGGIEQLEITSQYLIAENKTGISKVRISEIEAVKELPNNFIINLSDGSSFIVSKKGIQNLDAFMEKWMELNLQIIPHKA